MKKYVKPVVMKRENLATVAAASASTSSKVAFAVEK